jgi:urease accessory protein
LQGGARLEWLPQETTCHSGALAENRLHFDLEPGAEMIGWDLLSLGLPASRQDFERGRIVQTLTLGKVWREHGVLDGEDRLLLDSPVGLAGHRVLGTMWFASGEPLAAERRTALLQTSRNVLGESDLRTTAGSSSPHPQAVVLRVLAPRVEAAQRLLASAWAAWRQVGWGLAPCAPRVWRT